MYYNDTCNNIVNILIDLQYSQNIIDNIIHNYNNDIQIQNNVNNVISNNVISNNVISNNVISNDYNYNYLRTSTETPSNELIHINFINDLQYLAIFFSTKNSIFKLPVFPNEISNNNYKYIFIETDNSNVNLNRNVTLNRKFIFLIQNQHYAQYV